MLTRDVQSLLDEGKAVVDLEDDLLESIRELRKKGGIWSLNQTWNVAPEPAANNDELRDWNGELCEEQFEGGEMDGNPNPKFIDATSGETLPGEANH